jgi:DNA-binding transcriptional LysR family regulator
VAALLDAVDVVVVGSRLSMSEARRLLARARERFPLLEVAVEIGLTSGMVGRLGTAFDIVIAMHPEGAAEGAFLRAETPAWIAAYDHAPETLDPLPVALSDNGCLFRTWAERALQASGRPWRLAYVSRSLAAVEAIVAEGLAVTVVKRSMIGNGFRSVAEDEGLPKLPGAELRLHLAPGVPPPVALFADQLREGFSAR